MQGATRDGDANNHIAVHHQLTNHNIDWDSAQCLTYSTNYFQRLLKAASGTLTWSKHLLTDANNYRHDDEKKTHKRTSNRPTLF